jgi:hypothetical protein
MHEAGIEPPATCLRRSSLLLLGPIHCWCVYVILLIFVERKKKIIACGMTLDLSDGDGQENMNYFFSFTFSLF